jgi:hypothetical protein
VTRQASRAEAAAELAMLGGAIVLGCFGIAWLMTREGVRIAIHRADRELQTAMAELGLWKDLERIRRGQYPDPFEGQGAQLSEVGRL